MEEVSSAVYFTVLYVVAELGKSRFGSNWSVQDNGILKEGQEPMVKGIGFQGFCFGIKGRLADGG